VFILKIVFAQMKIYRNMCLKLDCMGMAMANNSVTDPGANRTQNELDTKGKVEPLSQLYSTLRDSGDYDSLTFDESSDAQNKIKTDMIAGCRPGDKIYLDVLPE